ncbi:hypothetical protein COLO4_05850 [Corchorus olitorius]|uniref:Uncharacterized protein n=1 Tax=Corchorus olitorius TaxID=93759 RepID=A0A1R3KPT8_9ROSI|nr:hypothetical protein COLO4_05850 [Corchorus olitorius]
MANSSSSSTQRKEGGFGRLFIAIKASVRGRGSGKGFKGGLKASSCKIKVGFGFRGSGKGFLQVLIFIGAPRWLQYGSMRLRRFPAPPGKTARVSKSFEALRKKKTGIIV